MWSRRIEGEGYTPCVVLGITSRQGKTNQVGRLEDTGANTTQGCGILPFGSYSTVSYLFWRFEIEMETPPNATEPREWYNTFFMRASDAQQKRRSKRQKTDTKSATPDATADSAATNSDAPVTNTIQSDVTAANRGCNEQ